MPRAFASATAEQVVVTVEAVVAHGGNATVEFVAEFTDLKREQAKGALDLAADLGLVGQVGQEYHVKNPIAKLLRTPHDKERAAVLRVMLEGYEPFVVFREELTASDDANAAAIRTKTRLSLDAHREDVKSTLLGLALYSAALTSGQGGKYQRDSRGTSNLLLELAAGATEQGAAVHLVREHMGADAAALASHDAVILPLADAIRHAVSGASREAIVHSANAVEKYLEEYAGRKTVSVAQAHGVNAKLDTLARASALPPKLLFNGKYLGHLRIAADHGPNTDIDNNAWSFHRLTGANYVFVALSFIRALRAYEAGTYEL